jgi:hypothetical protein
MKMKKQDKGKKVGKVKKSKEQIEEMSRTPGKTSSPAGAAKEPAEAAVSSGPVVPRAEGKLAGRTQPGVRSVVPVKPSEEKPVAGKEAAAEKAPAARSSAAASSPGAAKKEAEPHGIKKEYSQSRATCKVTFKLPAAAAPAAKQENGDFAVTLDLHAGREYRFRYLIDGKRWENDWRADKYVMSPYGGDDSVVCL